MEPRNKPVASSAWRALFLTLAQESESYGPFEAGQQNPQLGFWMVRGEQ